MGVCADPNAPRPAHLSYSGFAVPRKLGKPTTSSFLLLALGLAAAGPAGSALAGSPAVVQNPSHAPAHGPVTVDFSPQAKAEHRPRIDRNPAPVVRFDDLDAHQRLVPPSEPAPGPVEHALPEGLTQVGGMVVPEAMLDGAEMVPDAAASLAAEGDPQAPVGPVFLRDRSAGTDVHLLNTHLEWTGNPFAGEYLVLRDDADGLRVLRRDDAEPIALPEGTTLRGVLDEGALWLVRPAEDHMVEELRWTPGDAEPVLLVRHAGTVSRRGDALEIFDDDAVPAPNEGSLSAQPLAGGPLVHLADHVHRSHGRLADGRILTIVGEDATGHGPLRLLDPEDGSWVQLDLRGFVQSPRLSRRDPFDGDVVFATNGGVDGERGVYRARVPR